MRSSKSRSRNKNRNNRPSGGNIINRVFDSSGPDGKVRGTPQQIIEKYNQMHRDAQLAGDRVDAENFAQHAEHYTRLLANAQKEMEKQREAQEQANRDRQAERDRERAARLKAQEDVANGSDGGDGAEGGPKGQSDDGNRRNRGRKPQSAAAGAPAGSDPGAGDQPEVDLDIASVGFLQADASDSGLVETPEEKAVTAPKKRGRPRKAEASDAPDGAGPAEAAE